MSVVAVVVLKQLFFLQNYKKIIKQIIQKDKQVCI